MIERVLSQAMSQPVEKQGRKTEDGLEYPAEAYAYAPDLEHPSTWKLRLWQTPELRETARMKHATMPHGCSSRAARSSIRRLTRRRPAWPSQRSPSTKSMTAQGRMR